MRLAKTGLMFMLSLATGEAGAIIIDGGFSDWEGIQPVTAGLLSECTGDGVGGVNDLRTVWITSDSEALCLSILCTGPVKGSTWGPTLLAIDSDMNEATGFPAKPLGVDYLIQPFSNLDGKVMIHRRIDGENNDAWSRWHAPIIVADAYAVGRGSQNNRVEMRIPWEALGIKDSASAMLRLRICDGSTCLNPSEGDWAPDCRLAWFSVGNDARAINSAKDLCANGDFEHLQEAAARPLPQDWSVCGQGRTGKVEISGESSRGKRSLRMTAGAGDQIGMNSAVIPAGHGYVRFQYKILKSAAGGANLSLYAIGLNGANGTEVRRDGYTPPKEHVGDGRWHEGRFEFDFSPQQVRHVLMAPRINENVRKTGEGDWLIDAVEIYAIQAGPRIRLANVWSDRPLARVGETIRFSAWVENTGDEDAQEMSVLLQASEGLRVERPVQDVSLVSAGSYYRLDWNVEAKKAASVPLKVIARVKGSEKDTARYRTLVVDRNVPYTRQELCTDETGYWRLLDKPVTLQEGNTSPLTAIPHKKSSEIKRSPYGICTHLPRSKDYEDPFNPSHLIDDDPETCWSSQQNPSTFPGRAPWAEIDLGRAVNVTRVDLIPYWRNMDFPLGFSVRTSLDGRTWKDVLSVKSHRFDSNGPKRGDKVAQCFTLATPVQARHVRVDFERLPLSGGNYAEVSQGYKARLSGIEVIDDQGQNAALASRGATIKVSDVFTCWQNTAKTVNESFDRIFDIGLKWVRVGQWGDQTEWAAVERVKGEFRMDPVTDASIQRLYESGVQVLYGLDYGNALYERPEKPWGDIGPIYKEGHPFYLNGGPRTEQGRQAFVRYVDFVVRKYKDRIRWWELWNEENGWYPGHEPELYGKLLAAVAKHIKSIDPNLKVMFGGTAAPAPITTEIALREGAAPYIDAYAFHPYGIDKPEGGMGTMEFHQGKNLGQSREQTGWNRLEDIVAGVKKPFAQHGRPEVEVWLNEWGTNVAGLDFTHRPGIGEYGCAKYLMRFYIYSGWLNVPTAWWALYNENRSQDWGILEQHGYGLRPMSHALQNVCSVVSDVEPIRTLRYKYEGSAPDAKVIAYARDGTDETLVVVWAAELSNERIKAYPSRLSFELEKRPSQVVLTDLYWGVRQPAVWTHEDGFLTLTGLVIRDYPVTVSCR
ncbi:MAG: discoidin domain-containing protein [Phycisphaerae bacterium]|nr:discoidin domain-containing protein [Phycisphaerae bacterium]